MIEPDDGMPGGQRSPELPSNWMNDDELTEILANVEELREDHELARSVFMDQCEAFNEGVYVGELLAKKALGPD